MKETINKIDIFWTGGMDSTFRVIQLLLTTNYLVQPHYIVRHEHSTGIEIYTQIRLRRMISSDFPEVMLRLLPTIYTNENLIPEFNDINEQITDLRKNGKKIVQQYELMANYCREFNINKIDVALDKTPGEPAQEWLDKHFAGASAFDSFTYPIFHLTKIDMIKIAQENKWDDILALTSFCRRPNIKITPCGQCGPCIDAVISGVGFRLPFIPRMKAKIQIPFRRFWRNNYYKHQDKWFFKFAKRFLEARF